MIFPVTSIGSYVFSGCTSLTSIEIPNSVTAIGQGTFQGCSNLESILLPENLTEIGYSVFKDCSSLTDISIPQNVTAINLYAFYGCKQLKSIVLPDNVKTIREQAFYDCQNLSLISMPNSVTKIEKQAFANCSELTDVYCYVEKVPTTEADVFQNSYIEYATLHVPEASIDAYKAKEPWSGFSKIVSAKPFYTLTYILDGETYKTFEIEEGTTIVAEEELEKEGYTFSGWSETPKVMPGHDVTVTGSFTINSYTLTYMVDGEVYKSYTVEYGATVEEEVAPEKEGYIFSGWSETFATMPAHDVTVRAEFAQLPHPSYKRNLSSQTTGVTSIIVGSYVRKSVGFNLTNKGTESIVVTKCIVKNASNFSVVSTTTDASLLGTLKAGQSIGLSVNLTSDITTCYEWHYTYKGEEFVFCSAADDPAAKHDVTYYVDGEMLVTYEYDTGDDIVPEDEPTKDGYTFSGWRGEPTTMPNRNVTVNGTFTANKYTLAYEVDGEIIQTYEVECDARIPGSYQPTKEGYTFITSTEIPKIMPAHDVTIKGTFVVNKYTLTYKVDGEITKISEVEYGTALTAEAEPTKEGYTFSGWSKIPATMPAQDVTVTGSFTLNKYTLTYMVDDEVYKTYEVEYGASITPEADPEKEGYTFDGWSEIPETMPAQDVTITGTFTYVDAIADVKATEGDEQIYTIDGKAVGKLQKGVNIIRTGNKTKKVFVK